LFSVFSFVCFLSGIEISTASAMAHDAGISNLSRQFGEFDFLDGPGSAAGTDTDVSSARGSIYESATGSDSDDGGESLDSTYGMQSNPDAFYNYADPSVISDTEPHAEAPAQPVFGCVVERFCASAQCV